MRVKILDKVWNLIFCKNMKDDGLCDHPNAHKKSIRIAQRLKGQERLEVILHELQHAANWHLDEEYIERSSHDIAHVLWKLGYRTLDESGNNV